MAPFIEVSEEVLKGLNQLKIPYDLRKDLETKTTQDSTYIKLPSGIYVTREKTGFDLNWDQQKEFLENQNQRMLTIPEFREFLQYCSEKEPELFKEITEVRDPWRAENLGTNFEKINGVMYAITHKGKEKLDKDTLMEDRKINLEAWLSEDKYVTKQGLPKKNIPKKDLSYWSPREGVVVRFGVYDVERYLDANEDQWDRDSDLGVRGVKK